MVTRQNATERVVAPSLPRAPGVGTGVVGAGVGAGFVGVGVGAGVVGAGVGEQVPAAFCWTPHDVDSHGVP